MVQLQVLNPAITQDEIDTIIGLKNQIRHLKKMRRKRQGEVFRRLLAGATVELGVHCVEIRKKDRGSKRTTSLKIW